MHRLKRWEISFRCSVTRTSCAGGRWKQFCRNLSFLNSYVHSAELHNKQEFLHPSALKCRFFAQNGWLHFQAVLHSLQPSSKILRSWFFREELDWICRLSFVVYCQEDRKKGALGLFISSGRWLANFRYKCASAE